MLNKLVGLAEKLPKREDKLEGSLIPLKLGVGRFERVCLVLRYGSNLLSI
jgi:hypothetical protein